ncbi:MAG: FxLYD domain-containing protein [Armatimonadota bacterium]|nr:FxLYD domain-containing protein [Armatimonadota bacterium]
MSRIATVSWLLISIVSAMAPGYGAPPARCVIEPGRGIGAVRIWMPEAAALAVTGRPLARQTEGRTTTYAVAPPFAHITVAAGVVQRVSTRATECRTATGVGPGSTVSAVRVALAHSAASGHTVAPEGEWLTYPFDGILFFLRAGRVDTVEVFGADRIGAGRATATPSARVSPGPNASPAPPTPQAATWTVRHLQPRMDGNTLVVTGTVDNRGPAQAVYAEVTAFDPNGRQVGSGDGPIAPTPVPPGGSATFEARLMPTDIVGRVTAVIRPIGMITGALAEHSTDVTARQQFAPVVARRLHVAVQVFLGPARIVVDLRNGSAASVEAVALVVDFETRCFVEFPRPGRFLVDTRSQSVTVPSVPSGGTARATVTPAPSPDGCAEFTITSAKARIADLRLSD